MFTIFEHMCREQDYHLSSSGKVRLKEVLGKMVKEKDENFGNARDVRNYLSRVIERQANRLVAAASVNKEQLLEITVEDL